MTRTGDIIDRVGVRMVITVIRDPRARRSGSIENCEENQDLFRDGIQLHRSMRECPMVRDSSSQSAETDSDQRCEEYGPPRQWEKHDSDTSDDMNQEQVPSTVRLSPSTFHQGCVQGCFSTSDERCVNGLPRKQNREMLSRCRCKPRGFLTLEVKGPASHRRLVTLEKRTPQACRRNWGFSNSPNYFFVRYLAGFALKRSLSLLEQK